MNCIEKFDTFFTYKNLLFYEQIIDDGLTWISHKKNIIPMVIEDKEIGTSTATVHILMDGDLKTFKTFQKAESDFPHMFKVIEVFNKENLLDLLDFI